MALGFINDGILQCCTCADAFYDFFQVFETNLDFKRVMVAIEDFFNGFVDEGFAVAFGGGELCY